MKSEKVKEIKKALSCSAGDFYAEPIDCKLCKFSDKGIYSRCKGWKLAKDSLTLINELESENERLSSRYRNLEINYNDTWEHYREYEVENQKLKDRIAELENQMCRNEDLHTATEKLNDTIILKQFAERLKEKCKSTYDFFQCPTKENRVISISDIDEALKEFIDANK